MHRSITPRLTALCAASLTLLASATASATSLGLSYEEIKAQIVCATSDGHPLVDVTGAAPLQGGAGLEAIFDDAYAPLLDDDAQETNERLEEMKAAAVEQLAFAEQLLDASFTAYPDKLVAYDERACLADDSPMLASLYDDDLIGDLATNAQLDCKGTYSGEVKMDLVEVLGWHPPYVEETDIELGILGNLYDGSGQIQQHLATIWDSDASVRCDVSTSLIFFTVH